MSRCLTDYEVQAVADGEATADQGEHVAQCSPCAERVAARRRLIDRIAASLPAVELPPAARTAIRARLDGTAAAGATTLRPVNTRARWVWALPLAAAGVIALITVVIPGIDRQTTVSASEILARSRTALVAPVAGIEVLTYDLDLAGVFAQMIPEEQAGRFSVQEVVDHDHPGRYRIVKLTGDGQIVAGAADDPLRETRTRYIRANGRGYLLQFDGAEAASLSLPALKRTMLETFIGVMQASSAQTIREVPCADERCYEIDIPRPAIQGGTLVSLDRARAIVTVGGSQIVEFSASGSITDRPFTVLFALRSREVRPATSAQDTDFEIAAQPGDVVLHGNASNNPVWDVLTRALGEIPAQGTFPRRAGNPGGIGRGGH